jgi:hypothetical protein
MVRRSIIVALVLGLLAFGACGDPRTQSRGAGAGGDDSVSSDRDVPTSSPPSKDDVVPNRTDTCPPGAEVPTTSGDETDSPPSYFCPQDDERPYSYRLVRPQPGMTDVKPIPWEGVEVSDDGTTLTLLFVSGVEPCYVLDHVAVKEGRKSVVVILFEGRDPAHPDAACIEIAVNKAVEVSLEAPLGARKVVDGTDR